MLGRTKILEKIMSSEHPSSSSYAWLLVLVKYKQEHKHPQR